MSEFKQKAEELAEKCAALIDKEHSDSFGNVGMSVIKQIILTELKIAELLADKERLNHFASLVWETRWASQAEDCMNIMGLAAEIRSGNFKAIDDYIAAMKK